jgi:predicted permease
MLSLVLAQKILSLFVIMAMGFALVKSGVLKPQDSRAVSLVSLYVISPCMLLSAFQIDRTPEVTQGFLTALAGGFAVQLLYLLLSAVFGRLLRLDAVEKTSALYSNCGNLIVPLVVMVLGQDMVIYCTAYLAFQTVLMWSHGLSLMRGKRSFSLRDMLLRVNMLAVYAGLIMFFTGLRFPNVIQVAVDSVGSMVGPSAMLVTGMIMGGIDFKSLLGYRRLPIPVLLRLVVFPLAALALLKFSPLAALAPNGAEVLLVVLLAAAAPSASTMNQMAQIYDHDAGYASAINVVTFLLCIVTMPFIVALYQL